MGSTAVPEPRPDDDSAPMRRTRFHVAEMDCPSEEQLIRAAVSELDVVRLEFSLEDREVIAWHRGDPAPLSDRLTGLGLGAELLETDEVDAGEVPAPAPDQRRALRWVLAINAAMFAVELVAGWLAESTGLLADSLDMLADAAVYGIALWAVGRGGSFERRAARISGWLQLCLGLGVLAEVARRAAFGSAPEPPTMLSIAALALTANVICMLLLARHRSGGAHMRASWIFTSTDVIANAGVIAAGALVAATASAIPDLVIGAVIGLIVLRAATRILRLGRG